MYNEYQKVPLSELRARLSRFHTEMDRTQPDWEIAVIFSKVNLYYFTGTMQEGMLLIPRSEDAVLWVRRSYERALDDSLFPDIRPMDSYRDAAAGIKSLPASCHIEAEIVPVAFLQRFQKYFPFKDIKPLDRQISSIRSVKSPYELTLLERSGQIHKHVLEDLVPGILKEGMSEAEFATELYSIMVREGHHGISRFSMFDTEIGLGQIGFGVSSIYPSYFNGPGGHVGLNPASPMLGSRERRLKKGDLVFADVGCGVDGYHTDKTMTYMFGSKLPDDVISEHRKCVEIQNRIAEKLKPGAVPAEIYKSVMNSLEPDFIPNFMGFGARRVKFLGHGIGLQIDEYPVIAEGFTEPLALGMVLALEPKKGISGIGMVGIENTFLVTPEGGRCITGNHPGLRQVGDGS